LGEAGTNQPTAVTNDQSSDLMADLDMKTEFARLGRFVCDRAWA
jgi:hypothetical protein